MPAKYWDLKCCLKKLESIDRYDGLTELASTVLFSRGFPNAEAAAAFLRLDTALLNDPMLLTDMDKAVLTIRNAVRDGKNV